MAKIVEVRNSTAEFLTFVAANKEEGVQVVYKDETIWATQQAIATLFDKNKSTISRHIANIYSEGELQPEATVAKFATVVNRGIRGEVEDDLEYYNLDMIISVGYRTNSVRATQFRQWATYILRQLPSVVMCWTASVWRTVRSSVRIISSTCLPRFGKSA